DFQLLGKSRQNSAPHFGNQNHIFEAHSTESGIIKPRLDGEHLAILQRNFLYTRMLMNLQTQTVPGAVKEPHSSALATLRPEPARRENVLDPVADRPPVDAGFDPPY